MAASTTRLEFDLKHPSVITFTDLTSLTPVVTPSSGDESATTCSLHCWEQVPPTTPSDLEASGDEHDQKTATLPPVDTGKDAWLFLAACFIIEALVWGLPYAYGIFEKYYVTHEPFRGQPNIAIIGTLATGIIYLDAPIIMGTLRIFPRQGRWSPTCGLLIMCISLALSSFSSSVGHLIVTQGVLYAIGGSICYSPCIHYMNEWFVHRKGLAYGIMCCGTGIGGIIIPLLAESLLGRFGWQATLRVFSVVILVAAAPLSYFIKPRIPPSASARARPSSSLRFLLTRTFLLYQLANIAEALAFFIPIIYLPLYAESVLGASTLSSTLTIVLVNIARVFGCVTLGAFIDRLHVTTCLAVSTVGATLGVFLLWGLAADMAVLYVFCVAYGLFAGSFSSGWPGVVREVVKLRTEGKGEGEESSHFDPSMVFAFLLAGRGVGNVVSGPLCEFLVDADSWQGKLQWGYGSGYGSLIVFTGVTTLVGGASFLFRRIGWI